jgi:hypothetical protein
MKSLVALLTSPVHQSRGVLSVTTKERLQPAGVARQGRFVDLLMKALAAWAA